MAALISVPLQYNYDHHFGSAEQGHKSYVNFQPVVPISINPDWNMISRTILPINFSQSIPPGESVSGLGDIVQSLFFSPKQPTAAGLIWGAGPVFLLPSGTDSQLSARKWGLGPTAVLLKQAGPYTYGILANHIWSVAGSSRAPTSAAPSCSPSCRTRPRTPGRSALNTESTYDWKNKDWSVPINVTVSKLVKFGDQHVSLGAGLKYWADSPDNGPHDFGGRLIVTFLFPK